MSANHRVLIKPNYFMYLVVFTALCVVLNSGTAKAQLRPDQPHSTSSHSEVVGYRDGYLSELEDPNEPQAAVVIMKPINPNEGDPLLQDKIFNNTLSREFQSRAKDYFGYTPGERAFRMVNINGYQDETSRGQQAINDEEKKKQKEFGDYMSRRLVEYHVDDYFKSEPAMRQVYEMKERLSHVNVEVSKGVKVTINYSYSGNYADLKIDNPYAYTQVRLNMDPSAIGPTEVREATVNISKPLTSTVIMQGFYTVKDGILSLVTSKTLTPQMSLSLSGGTYLTSTGTSPRQNSLMAGLGYSF